MPRRILIALGGNAIKQAHEKGASSEQFKNCMETSRQLVEIIKRLTKEDRLVITHGNGPQAGNLLVQQDEAKEIVPAQALDILVAMTQGQIGYMLQQTLTNCLRDQGINTPVCAIMNQVLVDKSDPELCGKGPSKPVGDFFTKAEAANIAMEHPEYVMKKVRPKGRKTWRRCVPSPRPKANVEAEVIKKLVEAGIIVIASGGGGVPVTQDELGRYRGIEAVIDKDLAGEELAEIIDADVFLILTDVDRVKLNFGETNEEELCKMTLREAKAFFAQGQFLPGSMGPKVEACIKFIESGGKIAVITSLNKAVDALDGKAGTVIS